METKSSAMKGVTFITDETHKKRFVQIELNTFNFLGFWRLSQNASSSISPFFTL